MNRLFAWRYFHSPYSTQAIHLIAWVAITAIAVGTAALIIILSVFNGFEGLVKGLYGDFYASVKVVPAQGKTLVWSKAAETQWRQDPAVLAIAGVVEEKALLSASAPVMVNLLGIDSNYQRISPIRKYLRRGSFQLGSDSEPAVVMGSGVESALGLYNGPFAPRLTVYLPNRAVALTEADGLQSANLEPAGVFVWQTEFDNGYAFTDRGFLQAMLDYGPREFTSIDVKTTMGKEDAVKQRLIAEWGSRAKVLTRYEQNSTLYAVMQNEKWIIYLLLSLILVVASFNMMGALAMLVLEKQKDMSLLMALGAHPSRPIHIFIWSGCLLGGLGTALGLVLGLALCWGQDRFHWLKLKGESFATNHYPVAVQAFDLVLVVTTVGAIVLGASWIAASRVKPQPQWLRAQNNA